MKVKAPVVPNDGGGDDPDDNKGDTDNKEDGSSDNMSSDGLVYGHKGSTARVVSVVPMRGGQ